MMLRFRHHLKKLIIAICIAYTCTYVIKYAFNRFEQRNQLRSCKYNKTTNDTTTNMRHRSLHTSGNNRKVVFILAQGRTGSTLLGDLFNKLDEFIYFYQPLYRAVRIDGSTVVRILTDPITREEYDRRAKVLLEDILNCRYRKFTDNILVQHREAFRCTSENKGCEAINHTLIHALCKGNGISDIDIGTPNIVIKELATHLPTNNIEFLRGLHLRGNVPLHVIHLGRDPRTYLTSHKRWHWLANNQHRVPGRRQGIYIVQRCKETEDNIRAALAIKRNSRERKTKDETFLRYTLLRYEDIAINPIKEGMRLSRFLELNITNHIVAYFMSKTRNTTSRGDPHAGTSTTARDIMYIVNKWRYESDMHFVDSVQFACEKVMRVLGYKFVKGTGDLKKTDLTMIGDVELEEMERGM